MVQVSESCRALLDSPVLRAAAAAQYGFVTRAQLANAGIDKFDLARAVRARLIERTVFGVFRFVGVMGGFEAKLRQGLLSLPPNSCVSHAAAAMLHNLDGVASASAEFIAPAGIKPRRGMKLHRTRHPLGRDEVTTVKGLAVTSVERTLLDIAQEYSYLALVMAMDCAWRRRLVTPADLRAYLKSHPCKRHRGRKNFERALIDCEVRGQPFRSALEVRWWVVSIEGGLPTPLIEPLIVDEVGELFPDFPYMGPQVVVETKGRKHHGTPRGLEIDARRELRLACLGYAVISITWSMLEQDTPRVIERVRTALEALSTQPRQVPRPLRRFRAPRARTRSSSTGKERLGSAP